jgi:hypothetical protein
MFELAQTQNTDIQPLQPLVSHTIVQQLTSLMQSALSSIQNLPSLTALQSLSAMPKHPYERLKLKLYGPEYKDLVFKTIDSITVPQDFSFPQAFTTMIDVSKKVQTALSHNLSCDPCMRCDTLLNTISGDQIIPNVEKQKQQIEFIEMVKTMDPVNATPEQLLEYSKKVVSEFIKMY